MTDTHTQTITGSHHRRQPTQHHRPHRPVLPPILYALRLFHQPHAMPAPMICQASRTSLHTYMPRPDTLSNQPGWQQSSGERMPCGRASHRTSLHNTAPTLQKLTAGTWPNHGNTFGPAIHPHWMSTTQSPPQSSHLNQPLKSMSCRSRTCSLMTPAASTLEPSAATNT